MLPALPAAAGAAMLCGPLNIASWGCCALNAASAVCCSLASCFGCRYTSKLAKLLYVMVFMCSAILGIFLRYWGKEMLSSWVTQISNVCSEDQCWGMQGAYRVSFSVAVWFAFFAVLTFVAPVTHLAGWLVKLLLFILILGLSVLIPAPAMLQYAAVARGFSVIFLLAQVLIILDFSYKCHEYLLRKMDERNAEMERQGWQPGVCSNCWAILYVTLSAAMQLCGLVGCGLLFRYFGNCQLNNFFTAETLVIGLVTSILSMMNVVGKGLLPPSIIFAYNTMLAYQAITNSPNAQCNTLARSDNQSQVSIYAGLAVSAFSVTWMAYSSAGSMKGAVSYGDTGSGAGVGVSGTGATAVVSNPATPVAGAGPVTEWPAGKPKGPAPGAAATYNGEGSDDDEESGNARRRAAAQSAQPMVPSGSAADGESHGDVDPSAWIFHVIMCLGGMYLAMLVTNWGDPNAANATGPAINPELSEASMWARMGSQWAIQALFVWTLIAPICCPNRDFGR